MGREEQANPLPSLLFLPITHRSRSTLAPIISRFSLVSSSRVFSNPYLVMGKPLEESGTSPYNTGATPFPLVGNISFWPIIWERSHATNYIVFPWCVRTFQQKNTIRNILTWIVTGSDYSQTSKRFDTQVVFTKDAAYTRKRQSNKYSRKIFFP